MLLYIEVFYKRPCLMGLFFIVSLIWQLWGVAKSEDVRL